MATADLTQPACLDEDVPSSNLDSQNSILAPVFRLPSEILAIIFIYGASEYWYGDYDIYFFCVPTWINVSYVCRYWRNVALNCPTLWTCHFTVSLRWTDELLVRSKQAPLKIQIYSHPGREDIWWWDLMVKLLSHLERIQELRLHVPLMLIPAPLPLYAPQLQCLEFNGLWSDNFNGSPEITHANIPPLRVLKFVSSRVSCHSFNLSGVTTLILHCQPPSAQYEVLEFLVVLARMKNTLADLDLQEALVSDRDLVSGGILGLIHKVDLPRLVRLSVGAPLSAVIALLSCVNIPSKTGLRLCFQWEEGSTVDDYARIPLRLAQQYIQSTHPLSSQPTIRSLVVHQASEVRIIFSALERDYDRYLRVPSDAWETTVPLEVTVDMQGADGLEEEGAMEDIMSAICCVIPPTHLETLHAIHPPVSQAFWSKISRHFCGIRYMRLREGRMPELVPLLCPTLDELAEDTEWRGVSFCKLSPVDPFFPALTVLGLTGIILPRQPELATS